MAKHRLLFLGGFVISSAHAAGALAGDSRQGHGYSE
jgi:hypothetical protein